MQIARSGIAVDLPAGWEGAIGRAGALAPLSHTEISAPTVAHFANFPMPAVRADFGAEAVELMEPGDVFVVLFEFDSSSAGKALFASKGIPRVAARDFDRNALQRGIPGQSGLQRFFSVGDRAFSLYVVVGSHIDRADAVAEVNQLLESVTLS